jgi:hypothetical protein
MCTKKVTFIALSAIAVAIPLSAMAEPHWHDRDIRHFHEHDAHHWATGHWYRGVHDGRLAWWWVVGGALETAIWYPYVAPVYPYPDPYAPSTTVVVEQAPAVVEPAYQPAPQGVLPPPAPTAAPTTPSVWYLCKSSNTYYPYVASCPEGWTQVPASPPPAR